MKIPFIKSLFYLILPPTCIQCAQILTEGSALCPVCWKKITFISQPYCEGCGTPFEYMNFHSSICQACLSRPPLITISRSALIYDEATKPLIINFKYNDATYLAPTFSQLMLRNGADCFKGADMLIPIPLHRWRLFSRRYNQATLLGRAIAKRTSIPLIVNALIRIRSTQVQGHLPFYQRKQNVSKAFALRKGACVKGKICILIDDVKTTGSTLKECARVLLNHGAKEVRAVTLALVKKK